MRNLLLVACLTSLSIFSYAQCVVSNLNDAGAGSLRQAITELSNNPATCATANTVTLAPALVGGTITLNSTLNIFYNTAATVKTIDLSAVNITITSNNNANDIINVTGSNYVISGFNIHSGRNGINLQNGASNNTFQNLKIYGNQQNGIKVDGGSGNKILNNIIGLTSAGVRNPNGKERAADTTTVNPPQPIYAGVYVNNSGSMTISGNTISANIGDGIYYGGRTNANTLITNNKIGLGINGLEPKGNYGAGILVKEASGVTIGGINLGNTIAANGNRSTNSNNTSNLLGHGIEIRNCSAANTIIGNYVGTDISGNKVVSPSGKLLGNQLNGIYINNSSNNIIGGILDGQENIVGGNGYAFQDILTSDGVFGVRHGIQIHGNNISNDNSIIGNYIGLGKDGVSLIGNRQDGVSIIAYNGQTALRNSVGGTTTAHANIIVDNNWGVFIQGAGVKQTTIYNNLLGTTTSNLSLLAPNREGAAAFQWGASDNTFGSKDNSNIIVGQNTGFIVNGEFANWSGNVPAVDNTIIGNIMTCNYSSGISLTNDGNDNFGPVTINTGVSNATKVEGFSPTAGDQIDVYVADTCAGVSLCQNTGSASQRAQGLRWITSINSTLDTEYGTGGGIWSLNFSDFPDLDYSNIVVTATEKNGSNLNSTSEFNSCTTAVLCTTPARPVIDRPAPGFCPGQSVTLSIRGGAVSGIQYTWFRNGVKVAGGNGSTQDALEVSNVLLANGDNYTVKAASTIDTNTCFINSTPVKVELYSTPVAPAINPISPVCAGSTINISSSNNTFSSYTWSFDPATNTNPALTIASGQGTNQVSVNFGSATDTRKIRLNVTNSDGCPSTSASTRDITIRAKPSSKPTTTFSRVCDGTTVNLSADPKGLGESVIWTHTTGTGGVITSPETPATTVTGLPAGDHVFTYTVSNDASCTPAITPIAIQVDAKPQSVDAGVYSDICAASQQLAGGPIPLPQGMSGEWIITSSITNPTFTISNKNSPTAIVDNIKDGETLNLTWRVTSGVCTPVSDDAQLKRAGQLTSPNPKADFDTLCIGSTVNLTGNPPGVGETGVWSWDNGTIPQTPGTGKASVVLPTEGTYFFTYTINNNVCNPSSLTIPVVVSAKPTESFAGNDTTICTSSIQLKANLPLVGKGAWSLISGNASISDITSRNTQVTGILPGTDVELRWTISNGACEESIDDIKITRTPILTKSGAGNDNSFCEDAPILLNAITPANTANGETGSWIGPGLITNTGDGTATVTGLSSGTYDFIYSIGNNVCQNSVDTVKITLDKVPVFSGGGLDKSICTDSLLLNAGVVQVGTGMWSTSTGGVTFSDATNRNAIVKGISENTSVELLWTVTNGKCNALVDTVVVTRTLDLTSADAGLNDTICVGSDATLIGLPKQNGETITWTGSGTINSDSTASTTVSGLTVGIHTFTYEIDNGVCDISTDEVLVIVQGTAMANVTDPAGAVKPINTDATTLIAQAVPANYTGRWYISAGTNGSITSTNLNATSVDIGNVTNLNDTLTVCWEVTDNYKACPSTEECVGVVRLDISAPSFVKSTICDSDRTTFGNVTGTPHDDAKGEVTTWVGLDGATFTLVNDNEITPDLTGPGTYRYEYTISNPTLLGNPSASAIKEIQVDAVPTQAIITSSDGDTSVCSSQFVLTGNTPTVGTGVWSIAGTSIGSESTKTVSLVSGTSAEYVWTISNGVCPATSDSISVTRTPDLTEPGVSADQIVCIGNPVSISANSIKDGEQGVWTTKSSSSILSPTTPTTGVENLPVGMNYFVYTVSNGVCSDKKDSVLVDIKALPIVTSIGGDIEVCFDNGRTAKYFATGSAQVGQFIWTLSSDANFVRYGGAKNDTLVVTFDANTADQTIWVKAVSPFSCTSLDSLPIDISRAVLNSPNIDPGTKSCVGVENRIEVTNIDPTLDYTWSVGAVEIVQDNGDGILIVNTPMSDYPVTVTASRTDIECDITSSVTVDVFEPLNELDLTGLNYDDIILEDGKCDDADGRFPSSTLLKANVSPNGLPDLSYKWERIYKGETTTLASTTDSVRINYGQNHGYNAYRVTVTNLNCEDDVLIAIDSINVLKSVAVDFMLIDSLPACVNDTAIMGVRNNGLHDDRVIYTWSHNKYEITTDQYIVDNTLENRKDTTLSVVQTDTTLPIIDGPVLSKTTDFVDYDTYVSLKGGNAIAYDNYKFIGVLGEVISVKATPQYCVVYDELTGESLLTDERVVPVVSRPGAVAAAFDMETLEAKFINKEILLIEGYELMYDELHIAKVEDRFGLYDATDRTGLTFDVPLVRNWYVVDENGDKSQDDILSNQAEFAYPSPKNRPETVTYMLEMSNGVCSDSDFVDVVIDYMPWPPNAFSPNGDGFYDTWEITNVDKYIGTTVTIFNRWGSELVKINDYHLKENWWDGTKGGTPLPTGAYFYLVDFNNGTDPITGAVSLVK